MRIEPEVQELREWQREWAEENANIKERVDHFWAEKMPEGGEQADQAATANSAEAPASERPRSVVIKSPPEDLEN